MTKGKPKQQQRKRKRKPGRRTGKKWRCYICGTDLGIPGGMGGLGMCGPCCTGEASTLNEKGDTW